MDIYEAISHICEAREEYEYTSLPESIDDILDPDQKDLYELIKNTLTIHITLENGELTASPMIVLTNGARSYSVDDMTDEDVRVLNGLDMDKLPYQVHLKLSSILWVISKDHTHGEYAARKNEELYHKQFDPDEWVACRDALKMSIYFYSSLGRKDELTALLKAVEEDIIGLDGKDKLFLTIELIETLVEQKPYKPNYDIFLKILDKMLYKNIVQSPGSNNMYTLMPRDEHIHNLKIKIYKKLNQQNNEKAEYIALAKYYEDWADRALGDRNDGFVANIYYSKALMLYQQHDPSVIPGVRKKLEKAQKISHENMRVISYKIDISGICEVCTELYKDLSFEKAIVQLASSYKSRSISDIKKEVNGSSNHFSSLFPTIKMDEQGRMIDTLPPLSDNDIESETELYIKHMINHQAEYQRNMGDIVLRQELNIVKKMEFTEDDIRCFVENNAIIRDNHIDMITKGLYKGIMGDFRESISILAVEFEDVLRNIAEDLGDDVYKLDKEGRDNFKTLKEILTLRHLNECMDESLLFDIRCITIERLGGNIRNEFGHGRGSDALANSGYGVYFFCLVLSMVVTSSMQYRIVCQDDLDKLQDNRKRANAVTYEKEKLIERVK